VKRAVVALVSLLLVAAGVGWLSIPSIERHLVAQLRGQLERAGATRIDRLEIGLLARRVEIDGLNLVAGAGNGTEVALTRARVSGLEWPIRELLAGRTPFRGWRPGDPFIAANVEIENLQVADPIIATGVRVRRLVAEGVNLARFEPARGGTDWMESAAGPVDIARALRALALARLEITTLLLSQTGVGETLSVDRFTVAGWRQGRVADFAVDAFVARAGGNAAEVVRVERVSLREGEMTLMLDYLDPVGASEQSPPLRWLASTFEGFSGTALSDNGLALTRVSTKGSRDGDARYRWNSRVEGAGFRPVAGTFIGDAAAESFRGLGISELAVDVDCGAMEDRVAGKFDLERCGVDIRGLATIGLSFGLEGLDASFWEAYDWGDYGLLLTSKGAVNRITLSLRDQSLLDRALRLAAGGMGMPAQLARATIAQQVRRFQPSGVLITQEMTAIADTVARFVERGGELVFEAKPDPPFAFERWDYLLSPGPDLVSALGLSVRHAR